MMQTSCTMKDSQEVSLSYRRQSEQTFTCLLHAYPHQCELLHGLSLHLEGIDPKKNNKKKKLQKGQQKCLDVQYCSQTGSEFRLCIVNNDLYCSLFKYSNVIINNKTCQRSQLLSEMCQCDFLFLSLCFTKYHYSQNHNILL